jgi:hypothetical protein
VQGFAHFNLGFAEKRANHRQVIRLWYRGSVAIRISGSKGPLRHRPRRIGSARLAQEAEGNCHRSLIKHMVGISERPPRGGLSVFDVRYWPLADISHQSRDVCF